MLARQIMILFELESTSFHAGITTRIFQARVGGGKQERDDLRIIAEC